MSAPEQHTCEALLHAGRNQRTGMNRGAAAWVQLAGRWWCRQHLKTRRNNQRDREARLTYRLGAPVDAQPRDR